MGKPYGATPGVGELRPIEDGFLVLTPKGIQEDFAPDLTTEEKLIMVATEAPTQGAALGGTISTPAWRSKPTWFVIASNDRMIMPQQEKDSAEKMNAKTLTLPTSHVPMLSRPKEVAAFINDAATDPSRLTTAKK
jgi:pimeloyl-ACP methyl ester carboxylesterase